MAASCDDEMVVEHQSKVIRRSATPFVMATSTSDGIGPQEDDYAPQSGADHQVRALVSSLHWDKSLHD
jgi:hypothetical protein